MAENELIPLQHLGDPFKAMAQKFYELLGQFRLLTYGQLISRAVAELERPDVAASVHATLAHLIVDEYQDVNAAQERLIRLLTGPRVELCVVGDDDQAIYQWRGSDADERRLLHVAMTRARDWLSLSRHERITKNRVGASPYHQEVTGHAAGPPLPLPPVQTAPNATAPRRVSSWNSRGETSSTVSPRVRSSQPPAARTFLTQSVSGP